MIAPRPNTPSKATRKKRFIESKPSVRTPQVTKLVKEPADEPRTTSASPTPRTPMEVSATATLVNQTAARNQDESITQTAARTGQDESITQQTPPEPHDAPPLDNLNGTIATKAMLAILYANVAQLGLIAVICLISYEYGANKMRLAARAGAVPPTNVVSRGTTTVDPSEADSDENNDGLGGVEYRKTPTLPPTPPPRNPAV